MKTASFFCFVLVVAACGGKSESPVEPVLPPPAAPPAAPAHVGTCPVQVAIDMSFDAYDKPGPIQDVCTPSDGQLLVRSLQDKLPTADIETKMRAATPACGACLFDPGGAFRAELSPLTSFSHVNYGACGTLESGGNDLCGAEVQKALDCTIVACGGCVGDAAFDTCTQASTKGACREHFDGAAKECGGADAASTILSTCTNIMAVAQDLCAGGPSR